MSTIDLQSFCAKDDVRSYLMQPFVIDGYTYATNGHVIVRVRGAPGQEPSNPARAAAPRLFAVEYTDYELLPEIPAPQTCPECHGGGEEYEDECMYSMCRDGELFQLMKVGAAWFDVRYLHRIAQLPNVRISVVGRDAMAAFVFDGGEGRVMPCREK
jgi:hypothetical protein